MKTLFVLLVIAAIAIILGVNSRLKEQEEPAAGYILISKESNLNTADIASQNPGRYQTNADKTIADSISIGSRLTKEEVGQLIRLHNKARADVGVGPLEWSKKLAMYAQEWADHLASAGCKMEHRPHSGKWRQKHGENLFIGTAGYFGVADAVKAWEDEKSLYQGGRLNSSNWHDSGHYTQMVWSDTKLVGCAKVECDGKIIVVCNYDPPGNVLGQKPY